MFERINDRFLHVAPFLLAACLLVIMVEGRRVGFGAKCDDHIVFEVRIEKTGEVKLYESLGAPRQVGFGDQWRWDTLDGQEINVVLGEGQLFYKETPRTIGENICR